MLFKDELDEVEVTLEVVFSVILADVDVAVVLVNIVVAELEYIVVGKVTAGYGELIVDAIVLLISVL